MKKAKLNNLISIVIPVYGSEKILPVLVSEIDKEMKKNNKKYELILISDNSPDNSWNIIEKLSLKYKTIKGLLLRLNAGQHNAIMAGLSIAKGNVIVTLDDDLQHSPADIVKLSNKIDEGYDAAYANFRTRKHPLWKILGSKINNAVATFLIKKPIDLYLSPFRAFNSDIKDEMLRYSGPYVYIDGLILASTRNIFSVSLNHHQRYEGKSHYNFKKSLSLWIKMATNFSITPLRISSFLGIFFSVLGLLFAILLVIQKFTLNAMPIGWSSLIVTVLIIGGIQLLVLGMIGEYLGRILITLNNKPQYIISKKTKYLK